MQFEPLRQTLIDSAIALWHEVGLVRPWNDPGEDIARALLGPDSTVLAAVTESRVTATAMVGHDGHRGWVYYLAVSPELQGGGIGRLLMQACEAWVSARGVPKIMLMVRGDNTQATGFYEALGYEPGDVALYGKRLQSEHTNPL